MAYLNQQATKQYLSFPTMASTFVGMMLAVPFTLALSAPAREAGAQADQQSTAQVTQADFAKYAYAFSQGYEAKAVSATGASASVGACPVGSGAQAEVTSEGAGAVAGSVEPGASAVRMAGYGRGSALPAQKAQGAAKPYQERVDAMVNSFNSYTSMIYNSSSVTNTNSNNTVGSNNTSTNSVKVEDSKGVLIGLTSSQSAEQQNVNDSFNKDSYNTKTDTTIVNDSFNKETNVAIDSGNTTTNTENTAVSKVEDSYNTKNETKTDVNTDIKSTEITTDMTSNNTTNNTTTTENSNNSMNVEDNEVKLES